MRVAKLYDKISSHYSDFDYCDVYAKCCKALLECIETANIFDPQIANDPLNAMQMVDLGAGDGRFLEAFHIKYPNVKLTGLDISSKMLALAQQKVSFLPINIGIEQADAYLAENTYDLATANFVCAYVGLDKVLAQAKNSLKKGGYICVSTSTFESFSSTQQQVLRLMKSYNPVKRFVGSRLKQAVQAALVPIDFQNILSIVENSGFTIKKHKHLVIELSFDNGEDFLEIATRGGWIVTLFEHSFIPSSILHTIAKMLVHTFNFPFKDKCIVEVIMLQKK